MCNVEGPSPTSNRSFLGQTIDEVYYAFIYLGLKTKSNHRCSSPCKYGNDGVWAPVAVNLSHAGMRDDGRMEVFQGSKH